MDDLHIPRRDEYERYLVSMIANIDRSAREAAKPYVDALVRLRAQEPQPRFILRKEQNEAFAAYLQKLD